MHVGPRIIADTKHQCLTKSFLLPRLACQSEWQNRGFNGGKLHSSRDNHRQNYMCDLHAMNSLVPSSTSHHHRFIVGEIALFFDAAWLVDKLSLHRKYRRIFENMHVFNCVKAICLECGSGNGPLLWSSRMYEANTKPSLPNPHSPVLHLYSDCTTIFILVGYLISGLIRNEYQCAGKSSQT